LIPHQKNFGGNMPDTLSKVITASLLLTVLALANCLTKSGSEFVGKWESAQSPDTKLEIIRNGDDFLILEGTEKIGAVYKDGGLVISGVFGSPQITYIKESDTLLAPGLLGTSEYRRAKK
jgi:hypothetical protein